MAWLRGVLHELVGLFVDDASLALAVIVWSALVAVAGRAGWLDATAQALLLAVGIAALLVENVRRAARR
jgi:hypothetical protein